MNIPVFKSLITSFLLFGVVGIGHAQAPLKAAILPPRDSEAGAGDAAPVEAALVDAARATAWLQLANFNGTRLTAPRGSFEARVDPHAAARALGRETGAARVIVVELARLGEGRVVKALDPERFVGRVDVRADVRGAELQLDGRKVPFGVHELPVGTHAVRVTHPAYRDFLRFVDLEFDRTVTLDASLRAYAFTEGEMTAEQRKQAAAARRAAVPWYRTWWALTIAGGIVTAVTAGAIWGTRPTVHADRTVTWQAPPGP